MEGISPVWYKEGDALLDEIQKSKPHESELLFWYIGQCGFIFKSKKNVYIDPVLSDVLDGAGNSMRRYNAPFEGRFAKADYILCTHAHIDHMALPTLQGIFKSNPRVQFIVPGVCIPELLNVGISAENIVEAKAQKELVFEGLKILPIAAAHPIREKTLDGSDVSLSYFFEMENVKIFHTGDTYITEEWLNEVKECAPIDLFFTAINGGDYFRTARYCIGNINKREAAELSRCLNASITIPMHYDMIKGNTCDPLEFVRVLQEIAPRNRVRVPLLGERFIYRKE